MRFLAALAASLTFALGVVAILQGIADLAAGNARGLMARWEVQGHVTGRTQWEVARDRLLLASRLDPLNADYAADLGRLMEWGAWQESPQSTGFIHSRTLANDFYVGAIRRRPTWGFAWAHYAENRLLLGREDDEFRDALGKAIELAPWEPGVQRKVAWMGMATWDRLPPELREMVSQNIERAVQLDVHRHEIVRLAAQYDWLDELGSMMRSERQIETMDFVLKQIESR